MAFSVQILLRFTNYPKFGHVLTLLISWKVHPGAWPIANDFLALPKEPTGFQEQYCNKYVPFSKSTTTNLGGKFCSSHKIMAAQFGGSTLSSNTWATVSMVRLTSSTGAETFAEAASIHILHYEASTSSRGASLQSDRVFAYRKLLHINRAIAYAR